MRWTTPLPVALVLFVAASATADPVVTYRGPLETWPELAHETSATCLVGSLGQPRHLLAPDIAYDSLGFATSFDPLAFACPCTDGFTVTALHMVVAITSAEPATEFLALALGDGFLREVYPEDARCFVPSPCPPGSYGYGQYCYVAAWLAFPTAGFYEVTFPVDPSNCGCIHTAYTQTLVIWLHQFLFGGYFVTDDSPGHCPDHYAYTWFSGECRWNEIPAAGNLLFWADADCCAAPVRGEVIEWGRIKSLYR